MPLTRISSPCFIVCKRPFNDRSLMPLSLYADRYISIWNSNSIFYEVWHKSNETDFLFTKVFIFFQISVMTFKIFPLGSYTPMEKFPCLVVALEIFNRYGLQHVLYTGGHAFFYKDVLERLRKRVIRVRTDIADKWMLHHDNAPCHTALSVTEYLTSKGIPVVPQLPYSLDLSPCEFFIFHKLKTVFRGRLFGPLDNIQKSVTDMLKTIQVEYFQRCYQIGNNVSIDV